MKLPLPKLVLTAASAASLLLAAELSPQGKAWWSHIEYLASDALEGRRAGTPGHTKAAEYVAEHFERLRLKPGGASGSYVQPVALETRLINEPASSLEFVTGETPRKIKLGEEANLGVRAENGEMVEAELVFVGHALTIPEANINDLADMDLKGKIAFYVSGAPATLPGPLAAHAQSAAERWKALRAAGAIGTMSVADPKASDIPWARATMRRLMPSIGLTEPALIDNAGVRIGITVNPEHGDLFLAGTGHTINELLELHRKNEPLPRFPLKGKVRAKTVFMQSSARSENVVGVLPGSGPESVVISAHLDHLGIGGAVNRDIIYNGAMDNGSGIASVLEVARALSGKKLKRSVVFLAATAEEAGLLGSRYFAAHPGDAAGKIVADINLDMFLPIIPLKAITAYGMDESDLGPQLAQVAKKFGVEVARDPEPARNSFIRSDQYSFIRKGIPAMTFKFHAEPGTPEHKVLAAWRSVRYHAPSDDLQQPVEVEDAVKFNRIMAAFIEQVANRPAAPKWNEQSFFRRYAVAD